MDEKYMEMAGALAEAETTSGRAECSKVAIPTDDLKPEQYKRTHCLGEDCGEPLPVFRMQKGLEWCVDCQSAKERTRRR